MMRIIRVALLTALLSACGGGGEEAPSCQQAFAHYYGIGCTFVDLATGQPVPQGQITADCQSGAATTPDRCQGEFDTWLTCLNEVTACTTGDCSQEQMALLRCN